MAGHVDNENFVSSGLDILPTLCDYVGLAIPKTAMGKSLRSIAEKNQEHAWREYIVTENHTGRMLRTKDFKYCLYSKGERRESLVDLRTDPGEMNNLAAKNDYQMILRQHRRLLKRWMDETDDRPGLAFAIE